MYIKRNIGWGLIVRYAWKNVIIFTLWALVVFSLYYFAGLRWIDIPFQPLSVIGIAVSFYIGFKNSQSYDRFWEGRKIWGAIVNYSRTWANQVLNLVTLDQNEDLNENDLYQNHKKLIYRHIAWLHALRLQLRQPKSWALKENDAVERLFKRHNDNEKICEVIDQYLTPDEVTDLKSRKNIATHLIKNQAKHLKELKENKKLLDGFDHVMLMKCLEEFYNFQGKCERIKNTPFPRQYGYFSKVFGWIFVFLLPFGLLDVFEDEIMGAATENEWHLFLMIPISVLISWIFITWEIIGDNSEDPFEGRTNDVPMTALTRTIEIDLRDMLDEKELPEGIQPKDNILY